MKKIKMQEHGTKGKLITFCGLDGSGKTTLMNKLITELEKDKTIFKTKQPTDAVRQSEIFRTYMDSPNHEEYDYRSLSLLAASDRLQHVHKTIKPHLNDGEIVISDRYFYSCLANLRARGFYKDKWIYEISSFMINPDIAFFIDVPVKTAIKRVRSREDEKDRYIDIELQYKLREEYLEICKKCGGVLISTEMSLEESFDAVLKKVKQELIFYE